MLSDLRIKDLAIIEELEVRFTPGMNVLTGETGAGKSILVDALGLLGGARGGTELVRQGAESTLVEAVFHVPGGSSAALWLAEHGFPAEGDDTIVRRHVARSGKGRIWINGGTATLTQLRELAGSLLAIHGQNDQQRLRESSAQLELLDRFGGSVSAVIDLRAVFERLSAARRQRQELEAATRDRARRLDLVRYQLEDIDTAGLAVVAPGEEDEEQRLRAERRLLAGSQELAEACAVAGAALADDEESSAMARLAQAEHALTRAGADVRQIAEALEALTEAHWRLEEAVRSLAMFASGLEADPGRLEEVEARLYAIERLQKKYGASIAEILELRERLAAEAELLGGASDAIEALRRTEERAAAEYRALALALAAKRRAGAAALESAVEAELAELAMRGTRFTVALAVEPGDAGGVPWEGGFAVPTASGIDRCEFLVSANPGEAPRPLARIASGGELSRLHLALESVWLRTGAGEARRCLVFDEVDTGVGGGVAEVVGRKLGRLAERDQVLCVTHLPQVAAQAESHFAVRKEATHGRTLTRIALQEGEGRVEELARMAGGLDVGDAARWHARELLETARRPRGA